MIRVAAVLQRITATWPKGGLPESGQSNAEETEAPPRPLPTTPEEVDEVVARAQKRYRKGHRVRRVFQDPSGCIYEMNVDSNRQ